MQAAALESSDELSGALQGADVVFVLVSCVWDFAHVEMRRHGKGD